MTLSAAARPAGVRLHQISSRKKGQEKAWLPGLPGENDMVADAEVSPEPQPLHEELSTSQQEHPSPPADPASVSAATTPQTGQPVDAAGEQQLHGTVGKFIEAITEFFEEAEEDVSAHPAAHVIGGIVVGILIGRLVGRRQESGHD